MALLCKAPSRLAHPVWGCVQVSNGRLLARTCTGFRQILAPQTLSSGLASPEKQHVLSLQYRLCPELLLKGALRKPCCAPPNMFYADGIRVKEKRGPLRGKQAGKAGAQVRGMSISKVSAFRWAGWMHTSVQTYVSICLQSTTCPNGFARLSCLCIKPPHPQHTPLILELRRCTMPFRTC